MASPFRVFRKYQKSLLVGAGVILMFVFVIGDALIGYLGGSPSGGSGGSDARDPNTTAVKWDGGSLTNAEIDQLVHRRRITNGFLDRIHGLGAQSALLAGIEPRPLRIEPLVGPETPQSVVETRLFVEAAREAGMQVSNEAVVQHLSELGRGKVTVDDMRAILEGMAKGGYGVTTDYVIDALREEMLARNYKASHVFSFRTVLPEQRWKDWLRVNDRIVLEAAAIPVESFVIDVPEPKEEELVAFYDKWKNSEAAPEMVAGVMEMPSAAPGFRVPRKIDVQYIEADLEKAITKSEEQVTDEEIAKYYEENKEQFVSADTTLFDEEELEAAPTDEAETPAATTEGAGEAPPAEQPESEVQLEGETQPGTESAPESGESQQPASTDSPVTESAPSSDTAPPTDSESSTPAENDQSSRDASRSSGAFRLAAFLQNEGEEGASEEPATTEPAASELPTTEPTATPVSTPPADGAPAVESPSNPAESETPAAETSATPPATDATSTPSAGEQPKQYQPLDEVRDVIRRRLATERANEELDKVMGELSGQLSAEFTSYFGQRLDAESQNLKPPAPPESLSNLAPLAEKHGLTVGKTGPMPWLEMRNTLVGKSRTPDSPLPLANLLFVNRDVEMYQPTLTTDPETGNRYLAMKISDVKGRVPELAEVRKDVIHAYKLQKAAELALKDAEEQAKTAQDSKTSLADFFADQPDIEVTRTDPFSQLTRGDVPDQYGRQSFRLGQPDGIAAPGVAFLRRVFELKPGEVGAVLNNDHSIAYVVRVAEHVNSPEELRSDYLSEANSWQGLASIMNEHGQIGLRNLTGSIMAEENLEWERTADVRPQGEEEE